MIDHVTLGVEAANSRTGIFALVVDASLVTWTVTVGNAFRAASTVRIAKVFR